MIIATVFQSFLVLKASYLISTTSQGQGSGPKGALGHDACAGAKQPHSLLEVLGTPDVGVPQVHVLLHLVVAVLHHARMRLPRLKLLKRAAMRSAPRDPRGAGASPCSGCASTHSHPGLDWPPDPQVALVLCWAGGFGF